MGPIVCDKPWNWVTLVVALMVARGVRAERYQTADDSAKPKPGAALDAGDAATAEQVVVLQDGGFLRGRVTRNGERYVLARGTGEMFIPSSNVLLVAASLEDAYQQRRERLDRPTAENHLVLAEWCLRHDLLTHAERELADARALEPHHDQLALFERRLALVNERQQKQAA